MKEYIVCFVYVHNNKEREGKTSVVKADNISEAIQKMYEIWGEFIQIVQVLER